MRSTRSANARYLLATPTAEQADGWSSLIPLFTQEYAAVDSDVRRENPVNAIIQWTGLQRLFAAVGRGAVEDIEQEAARVGVEDGGGR